MVFPRRGWRLSLPAAACIAAAGIFSADAMDASGNGVAVTPSGAKLMWGGPVPKAPIPGKASVYVPSPSAYAPSTPNYPLPVEPETSAPDAGPITASIARGDDAGPLSGGTVGEGEVEPEFEPEPEDGEGHVKLYEPKVLGEAEPAAPAKARGGEALAPLGEPVDVSGEDGFRGEADDSAATGQDPWEGMKDPWNGLKDVTPGANPPPRRAAPEKLERRSRPSFADLQSRVPPRRVLRPSELPGRGALEEEAPSGYRPMPAAEQMCRRQLAKLGVRFVDAGSIANGRSCGIDYPVKVTQISSGIAMRPAATLNCAAALRVAEWMRDEVQPAARWKLLKRPTAVINASSYRCSRIAGSRSISEHASGNALDVAGFQFADGSIVAVEKKGFFDFREKAFQGSVRKSACEYFGTVLGPGYNRAHADHLHLDAKQRRRTVCK